MRGVLRFVCLAAIVVSTGCDLEEVTIVEVEDVVIAEIYVNLAEDPADNEIRAFLHRTVGTPESGDDELSDALIVVSRADGLALELAETQADACLESIETGETGVCFLADSTQTPDLAPGDLLEVRVSLADGGTIFGAARVPSSFELDAIPPVCRLDPNTLMTVRWSKADGAWAYVNETSIHGLPEALILEGIVVEDDPLNLWGLSISDSDTTTVFPSEFGVFDRFDLDQDLSVRLQSGLPASTSAEVSISAVEGNYVNWARGGSFNPSGQVRVPSLAGDGSGVFGATVNRRFFLFSQDPGGPLPSCPISDP